MSGSFLTGPPREANQGGKEGDFLALTNSVIARSEVTKQSKISQSWIATPQNIHPHPNPIRLEERDHSPSPRPSPLKEEGDYGQGLP
jgi:hypothetical protein